MIRIKKQKALNLSVIFLVMGVIAFYVAHNVIAYPGGASITFLNNESNNGTDPDSRQDPGGVIVTLTLDALQQTSDWKAYVGNVTGTLTLDDADNNTIYDWRTAVTSGEVYITRNTAIDFDTLNCTNASGGTAKVEAENAYYGYPQSRYDNINSTFNWTTHPAVTIGTRTIVTNACKSLYTFKNDASQADAVASDFSEVMMADNNSVFVYITTMETDVAGFDGATYDFQSIVPENGSNPVPVTYYFYVELGG